MPCFAATALGSTGGWARHPLHKHTWAKPQAGGRAGRIEAGASEGHQDLGAGMVAEWAQKCPYQRSSPRQSWATHFCSPCPYKSQPRLTASPATGSRGRRNGLCHPPLGGKSSLVPTVEQKAAHPGQAAPTPASPCPSPLPPPPPPGQLGHLPLAASTSHQASLVCIPPTQHLAQGPCPQGLQGKLHPKSYQELLQAEPSTERLSCTRPRPPTDLEVKAQGIWGEEGVGSWKELVPWVGEARTHDWEGQEGAMTALPHLWEPEGPNVGKHPPHQQPADVGSGRLASVS